MLLFILDPHILCKCEMQEKGPKPRKDSLLWFRIGQDIIINAYRFSCKVPVILVRF